MMVGRRIALVLALSSVACSSSAPSSAPVDAGSDVLAVVDSGAGDSAPPPTDAGHPDSSTACNALKNSILIARETSSAMVAPAAAGGTIADGVYHATSWVTYTGPGGSTDATGATKQSTLEIAGSVYQIVTVVTTANIPAGEQRQGGSFMTSGADVSLIPSCPATATKLSFVSYDADATKITFYTASTGDAGAGVSATTYAKQ